MIPEELDERDLDRPASDEGEVAADPELEEDSEDTSDDASDDEDEDAALGDDEEEGDQASLEDLIAQRAAGRKAAAEEEEDDIMALASEPEEAVDEALPITVAPISEQKEFVCKSCYQVKPRVQLADAERGYCRDCV